jgi:D-alanyl-D-alanine carboxypeptidase/Peptidase M15
MSESWFDGVGLAESPFAGAESPVAGEVEALVEAWPSESVGLPPSWPEDEEDGARGQLPFAVEAWIPWAPAEALAEAEEEGPGSGRLAASRLEWPGAPDDKLAFMRAVYDKHLERSRAKGETFTADLPDDQLGAIEGKHQARKDAAEAARALLAEARAALATAGLADKVRIGIISAYRPASRQFDIWQGKGRKGKGGFPYYYGEMLRRGRLRPGDDGPEAVSAMASELANWIAAPGYSNHQDGLAIDFGTGLVGRDLGTISKQAWFHKWLVANAARHGFHPYDKEAWHWVYRGPAGSETLAGEVATAVVRPGELPVERVPLLAGHRGRSPDLILRWNVPSVPEVIDVVVHLHGYWYAGLRLEDNIKPYSGLDLAPVGGAAGSGRSRPTLTVLPRGNDTGVKQTKGPFNRYTFPGLVTRDGLPGLVRFSLERFAARLGGTTPRVGRLILTAHSGGGAALLRILEHHDPHQVHVFDALYQDAGALAAWACRRIQRDRAELAALGVEPAREYMSTRGGALRVFYGRGTRYYSRKLQAAITSELDRGLEPWYRVEASRYGHFQIPRRYGWRVLADASTDVPDAYIEPVAHHELDAPLEAEEPQYEEPQYEEAQLEEAVDEAAEDEVEAGEVELGEAEAFFEHLDLPTALEEETGQTVAFPSGATLRVVSGPTGVGEEHYDPAATGNPLLDTSEPVRSTLLSANFTVGELARSGGRRFDKARIDPELVRCLQRLRDHVGKPMRITSSYRPYAYNDKLYKETYKRKPTRSRHSSGQAADIQIAGMRGMEIAKAAIDVLGPDIGVGIADTYAHVDVRGRWARWTYFGDGTERHRLAIAEIDAYRRRRQQAGAPSSGERSSVDERATETESLDEAEDSQSAAAVPPVLASGVRDMRLDAFYADERNLTVPRASHPIKSFYNVHSKADAHGTPQAMTLLSDFDNPLSDPAQATVLPQLFSGISPTVPATRGMFDRPVKYWLYVSPKLKERYDSLTDKRELTARVAVFFGVGPEPNLFGLRSYFSPTVTPVLVGVPGFERGWPGVPKAWGVGITTAVIRQLLDAAGLNGLPFQVEVMAGYSTGYRGLNLTAINKLVDLTHLKRFVYFDAFYWHNDHPMPPTSHRFHKKLTVWAVDTVFKESASAEAFIVGYTHPGATPRDQQNNPTGPLSQLKALREGATHFLDLEFKRDGRDPVADDLEKVCLARLLQGGVDDYFSLGSLPIAAQALIRLLPERGSLGVAGLPGYIYFRKWRLDPAVKTALAAFPWRQALDVVVRHKLLAGWSTAARIEFRHRDFVQEIGKELLLP